MYWQASTHRITTSLSEIGQIEVVTSYVVRDTNMNSIIDGVTLNAESICNASLCVGLSIVSLISCMCCHRWSTQL